MKKITLLFTFFWCFLANATHIVGGEMIYEHLGSSSYYLTIKLYKDGSLETQNFPMTLEVEAFTGFGRDTIGALPAKNFFKLPRLGRDTLDAHIETYAFNPGGCDEETIYDSIINLSDNSLYLTNSSPVFSNSPPVFVWQGYDLELDFSATDSNPVYDYTIPGTYTVTLTALSTMDYTDTLSKERTIIAAPKLEILAKDLCSGFTIDFVSLSDPDVFDFWWDFGTGSPEDTSIVDNPTFTYPYYGKYTVTLIAQKGTVSETKTTLDIIISDVTAKFTSVDTVCQNSLVKFKDASTTIKGAVITTWEWDFGDLSTSYEKHPSHTYTTTGNHFVRLIVTNSAGCTDTIIKTIYVQPIPIADAGADIVLCLEKPSAELAGIILNAESGIWSSMGGTFSPSNTDLNATYYPTLEEVETGFSQLILTTVGNGYCDDGIDTLLIYYLGIPEINAGSNIVFCDDITFIELDATASFGSSIIWTTDGDGVFSDAKTLTSTYTFGASDILKGTIVLSISTDNGDCPNAHDSLLITISAPPTLTPIADTAICSTSPLYLNSDVSTKNGIWSTNGDGKLTPTTGHSTTYIHGLGDLEIGYVTIYFESTDNGGCLPVYDTIKVIILPSPVANFDFTEVCFGLPTDFTNKTLSKTPLITHKWLFEPGFTSIANNPSYTFTSVGTFDVALIVVAENGCSDTITKDIPVHDQPTADFHVPEPCLNGGTNFYDSTQVGAGIITGWNWNFGDGTAIDTARNPVHHYQNEGEYDITLSVTSAFGCTADTTLTILINRGPVAAFTTNPSSAYLFVDIKFSDQTVTKGSPIVAWEWDFTDGEFAYTQNAIHQFGSQGQYNVSLIVKDEMGCIDTARRIVAVYHGPKIATAFSPNGDNNNDYLMILGGNFSEVDFKIYNNWGQLIFQTQDPSSIGWDGQFKDEPQPLGVYVYVAKVTTYDGAVHVISGDVSLIR